MRNAARRPPLSAPLTLALVPLLAGCLGGPRGPVGDWTDRGTTAARLDAPPQEMRVTFSEKGSGVFYLDRSFVFRWRQEGGTIRISREGQTRDAFGGGRADWATAAVSRDGSRMELRQTGRRTGAEHRYTLFRLEPGK